MNNTRHYEHVTVATITEAEDGGMVVAIEDVTRTYLVERDDDGDVTSETLDQVTYAGDWTEHAVTIGDDDLDDVNVAAERTLTAAGWTIDGGWRDGDLAWCEVVPA